MESQGQGRVPERQPLPPGGLYISRRESIPDSFEDLISGDSQADPDFMMGYWGEAMAHDHPIWGDPQETEAARKVIAKIRITPGLTQQERAYINAVKPLYGEGDRQARDQAYAEAMGKIYREYPDDHEAAAFYALALASCRLFLHGIRFLYLQVLDWPAFAVDIPIPKKAQRIPELLTRAEVGRILTACTNPEHRMMLTLSYGCGLRLSELVSARVRDIDGERQLLRIEQGKGAKDRLVPLSETLLARLDALAAYRWKIGPSRLIAQLNIRNLLDKEYYENADRNSNNAPRLAIWPGAPLTVLGSIRVEF